MLEATPRYPDELVPGGRLERGRALVFPNLFPLAGVHAVVTFPEKHFLRPSEFTPGLLEEGLGAALDFVRRAAAFSPRMTYVRCAATTCFRAAPASCTRTSRCSAARRCPGRSSSTGTARPPGSTAHGESYWRTLVDQEQAAGERYVWGAAGVHWLVPFAPAGAREALAVVPAAARLTDLGDEHVAALAHGLTQVLAWYEDEGLSAFNFTLSGGPLDGRETGFPVVAARHRPHRLQAGLPHRRLLPAEAAGR